METNATRARAVGGSLAIHAALAFILYWGLRVQPEIRNAASGGPAIEAMLVSAPSAMRVATGHHVERAAAKPAPPPPAPTPQIAPTPPPPVRAPVQPMPRQMQSQTQVPKPDTVDQDEVRRTAQLAAERAQKEQDERRRQAQIDLDRKQQQLAAENRQKQAQQQELAKQLAQIRAQRAQAERQAMLAQQKLQQDQDMRKMLARNAATAAPSPAARPPAAAAGAAQNNNSAYLQAIIDVVNRNWKHEGVPEATHCEVHFTQMRGGDVISVSFGACPFDAAARTSVEDALKKTPLPYAGFEKEYQRTGTIDLCYPEDACK